jgi:hypothetical protein
LKEHVVLVNRAPVLTLWAAVVAERLGFDRPAALSLGKALAGLNAQSKGRSLGIFKPSEKAEAVPIKKSRPGERFVIELLGRAVPAGSTKEGVRAFSGDRPVDPAGVETYLEQKFGPDLVPIESAMKDLAGSLDPGRLASAAYALYERFRPVIPAGVRGWGVKGELDPARIRSLRKS